MHSNQMPIKRVSRLGRTIKTISFATKALRVIMIGLVILQTIAVFKSIQKVF